MALTENLYKCWRCNGDGFVLMVFEARVKCKECKGKKYVTATEFKEQIIRLSPNNLTAIEMIEKYELNE